MAKVKRAFYGNATYGQSVEVAESVNGEWFQRFYGYNGYGYAWSKWEPFTPHWTDTITNVYTGEVEAREEPALLVGWNVFCEYDRVPRYKLPESAIAVAH